MATIQLTTISGMTVNDTTNALVLHNLTFTKQVDLLQTDGEIFRDIQSIPTTAAGTALTFGGLSTLGAFRFRNLDVTNFIQIGVQVSGTFYPFMRLQPLHNSGHIELETAVTYYALADTASVELAIEGLAK